MFRPAVRAADPGKAAAGVAAVEIALDHILNDRPEISIFPLKSTLVFRDEALEVMKKHSIEDRAFRMTRTVDSRHIDNEESRNAPGLENPESAESPEQKACRERTLRPADNEG